MKKIYRQNSNMVNDQSGVSLGFFIEKLFSLKIRNMIYYFFWLFFPLNLIDESLKVKWNFVKFWRDGSGVFVLIMT